MKETSAGMWDVKSSLITEQVSCSVGSCVCCWWRFLWISVSFLREEVKRVCVQDGMGWSCDNACTPRALEECSWVYSRWCHQLREWCAAASECPVWLQTLKDDVRMDWTTVAKNWVEHLQLPQEEHPLLGLLGYAVYVDVPFEILVDDGAEELKWLHSHEVCCQLYCLNDV